MPNLFVALGLAIFIACGYPVSEVLAQDVKFSFRATYLDAGNTLLLQGAPVTIESEKATEVWCEARSAEDGSIECAVRSCGSDLDSNRRVHYIVFSAAESRRPSQRKFQIIARFQNGRCVVEPQTVLAGPTVIEYRDRIQIASAAKSDFEAIFGAATGLSALRVGGARHQIFSNSVDEALKLLADPIAIDRFTAVRELVQRQAAEAAMENPSSAKAVLLKAQLETLAVAGLLRAQALDDLELKRDLVDIALVGGLPALGRRLQETQTGKLDSELSAQIFDNLVLQSQRGQFGLKEFRNLENLNRALIMIPRAQGG
jgi:hypothetical protein